MASGAKRDWAAWVAVTVVLLTQLATFAFSYGRQSAKLDAIDQRLQQVERVLIDRGARADAQ